MKPKRLNIPQMKKKQFQISSYRQSQVTILTQKSGRRWTDLLQFSGYKNPSKQEDGWGTEMPYMIPELDQLLLVWYLELIYILLG